MTGLEYFCIFRNRSLGRLWRVRLMLGVVQKGHSGFQGFWVGFHLVLARRPSPVEEMLLATGLYYCMP